MPKTCINSYSPKVQGTVTYKMIKGLCQKDKYVMFRTNKKDEEKAKKMMQFTCEMKSDIATFKSTTKYVFTPPHRSLFILSHILCWYCQCVARF